MRTGREEDFNDIGVVGFDPRRNQRFNSCMPVFSTRIHLVLAFLHILHRQAEEGVVVEEEISKLRPGGPSIGRGELPWWLLNFTFPFKIVRTGMHQNSGHRR